MTDRHEEFAEWDAAYVLGALSSAERAAYEQHLADCPECSESVRGLAVIPGLLGKVPAEEVSGDVSEPPPADLLARTRSMAQGEVTSIRRRRRWAVSLAAVAASVLLVIGGAAWVQQRDTTPPSVTVAMQQVHTNPLSATLRLHDKAWGTEVDMKCTYAETTQWGGKAVYALYVVDDAGHATSISTWSAEPGTTAKLTAATAVPKSQIAHLQVRNAEGSVLLSANPD